VRVYHFTTSEFGLKDIRLRRLKIATLLDVNDPFELAVCCSDASRRRALGATRLQMGSEFGMLCFSAHWHNPVQWSHYAEKHHGICLGFDAAEQFLTKVRYARNPPRLIWEAIQQGGPDGEAEMLRWSSTKYEHWRYEDEWRGFLGLEESDSRGRYFFGFGDDLRLRQVIVGPESQVSRAEVKQALNKLTDVECFKARLAFRNYRVVRQRDSSLWQ
jgi:hypothetical protein